METVHGQRHRAVYEAITRLCGQGLSGEDLFARVSAQLRKAVPFRTGGWLRLDPMTLLPMPGLVLQAGHDRARLLIHNEYFQPDFLKLRELAREPVPAGSLWQATAGQPDRSTRYRTILAGLGYGDEVRMVFRCDRTVWGAACLARSGADPPFSPGDIAFLARAGRAVGQGLRLSHLLAGDRAADPAPPGVLVLGEDDTIISRTEAALHWLAQLPRDHARGLELNTVILGAASQARALASGRPGLGLPEGRVRTSTGRWLRVHAASLLGDGPHGSGQTAVILEPAAPADLCSLILDLHCLTSREREITGLLLRGLATADIARALRISRYTLSDHMKAIFGKLGVSSRPELTALLLAQLSEGN